MATVALPTGTVTFVFTDIEGSTKLARDLGTDRWADLLAQHARIVRAASRAHDGVEVRTEGDSFFLAFRSAREAVAAAAQAQRALQAETWRHGAAVRVRIGMHTGENARPGTPESGADYVGYDVHHAARVSSSAHGGQILLSAATRALVGDALPEGTSLRDLGEHRLKDLSEPDRLYQLVVAGLPDAYPEIRTLARVPNDLPVQLTSFIGRKKELAEARSLFERTRLLTLVGPGGTGKSRLSLELAAQVMDAFPDGVWFVRLAAVSDPALIAAEIARHLKLVVPATRAPLDHVIDHLREKRMLLVLDNFEQVVAGAPDVGRILAECPAVKIVVTTRAVLRISGEQQYPVPPLTLPDPRAIPDVEELGRAEAIQLFLERARAAKPDLMLTAENARPIVGIVAQLDGLPLAIELAAAKAKLLPPQAILDRLASGLGLLQSSARDLPARQQTLRGAIAWSYDLLDPGAQRLFRRLAVFRGGAALEQVERVCGPAAENGRDVLDGLSDLVDQSLLRQVARSDEPRFVMLETIREFARERLDESGEAAEVDLRHALAYLELAERASSHLLGAEQKAYLDRLDLELGNLRVALDICTHAACADRASCDCGPQEHVADDQRIDVSLRLSAALWRFWHMRGHLREGRQRTERILEMAAGAGGRPAYIGALEALGGITYWQGDMEATERAYAQRLELARSTGDDRAIASALYDLSFVYLVTHERLDAGKKLLDDALARFRRLGDTAGETKALWALTSLYIAQAQWDEAAKILPGVVRAFRESGDRFGLGWALHNDAVVRLRLGDPAGAKALLAEGLGLFTGADDISGISLYLADYAELAATAGQEERAARLYGAVLAVQDRTGVALADVWRDWNTQYALEARRAFDAMDPSRREALFAEGRALTTEAAIEYALES